MRTKVAVTGAGGQLGRDLAAIVARKHDVIAFSHELCDISDRLRVSLVIGEMKPDILINCAAYTNVDRAETEPELAFKVNADGPGYLAEICASIGTRLIHISTDYVFDGESKRPYIETDSTNPLSVYGKSKLEGEKRIHSFAPDSLILRTAWVYGQFGTNFVKAMLKAGTDWRNKQDAGQKPQPLQVVSDQTGSPTWTIEIAEQILLLMEKELSGVFHVTAEGGMSRFEFAKLIFAEAGLDVPLVPCTSDAFPRPAKRPRNSVLENRRLNELGLNRMKPIADSLRQFIQETSGSLTHA